MELKYKYFHSVHSHLYSCPGNRINDLNEILKKFESILECGYIYPYCDLLSKCEGNISRSISKFNGTDFVSISLHKDNPVIYF